MGPVGKTGIMFLNEVALGKEFLINNCNGSLRKAPTGYDSIVALGQKEPGKRWGDGELHNTCDFITQQCVCKAYIIL